mmetsp:Transcript_420/g.526  ORF Transcript_420/g.526 Transcript_420/m.526 type:complete len:488 (-) Transcript_420:82-1545(-)|eukprot:CAMPEP_0203751366 /NCGR_PEP_ID=MMETSP0098-20131031/5443_1 /ASSEMBLY_ACC=CAM_ASM_000208 /TAXON_ID=96639 /ORGANISM=" , Strain NY0313808BC1" /LENGTH=487 /DNA_ID=CAMNT_0050641051 /DNA_START=105 /DNA_END=1568 /DNA_ORIENTATION=-
MEVEDDDPVELELDVYLNRDNDASMYLLNYPLRPAYKPMIFPDSARFRENNQTLELSYDMLGTSTYTQEDVEHHFELDQPVTMTAEEKRQDEKKRRVQVYQSNRANTSGRSYAAGIVDNVERKLYIVPVQGMMEMAPVLQKGFQVESALVEPETKPVAKKQAKAIEVLNMRKESVRYANQVVKKTYKDIQEEIEQEPWTKLDVHSRSSTAACTQFERLKHSRDMYELDSSSGDDEDDDDGIRMADDSDEETAAKEKKKKKKKKQLLLNSHTAFSATPGRYLDVMAGETQSTVANSSGAKDNASKSFSLEERVRQLFIHRGVVKFEDFLSAVTGKPNSSKLLELLPRFGVLCRGLWVVKSDIFYRERFGTVDGDSNNESIKRKCALRDLILACLNKSNGTVSRDMVKSLIKGVQSGQLREALTTVCVNDKENKSLWRLKERDDGRFLKQHPKLDVTERERWKKRELQALLVLGVDETEAKAIVKVEPK